MELKQTHKTRIQHGRQHTRQRQLQQLERQRQQFDDERRRASVSVVEARQKAALLTVRPRRSSRRRSSVPSRDVVVPQLTGVAGNNVSVQLDVVHRSLAHSTRARGSVRTSFSSSTSERLHCSKSTVELNVRSTTINWLEIRAHTRIVTNSVARACFCGKIRRTDRTSCSVAREQYRWNW